MFTSLRIKTKLLVEIIAVIFSINLERRKSKNEKKIKINNLSISYSKYGSGGNNLVFLHGWGQSKETWINIADNLQKNNNIYLLDLPGFGKSDFPSKILTIADYVEIINNFLKKLKINKMILIGHSFGGRIAVEFALKYPYKINKLVVYSTDFGFGKNISKKLLNYFIDLSEKFFFKLIIKIYLFLRGQSYLRFDILLNIYKKAGVGKNFPKRLRGIKKKTLLLYGKFDYVSIYNNGVKANKLIRNSRLIIFNKSSHLAHIEEKEKFIKELKDFINK